ncbi:MAG: helicase-exonuclease AddAB subunit AddA [Phycisphaerales bacterium]|nr:helicase-exonuclease AddAB subunit AddA [Phycisphaerales bacterium]
MTEINWTNAQTAAIGAIGRSVLVSAGAGSGKTAVLAERCAHLLADPQGCNADQLLVVTFTEAAAAEMWERIGRALRKRLRSSSDNTRLKYQLAMLDTAQISTIHAFCRRILNRYFAYAELDPQAPILDPNDAMLLRQETAKSVFDDLSRRQSATGDAFLDFVAAYGGTHDRPLRELSLKIADFLTSLSSPDAWIEQIRSRFKPSETGSLPDFWLSQLRDSLQGELTEQLRVVERQLGDSESDALGEFARCLADYRDALGSWLGQLKKGDSAESIDQCMHVIKHYGFPGIPAKRGKQYTKLDAGGKARFEAAQRQVKNVRYKLFERRLRDNFAQFTTSDWAEGISRTAPHVRTFLNALQKIRRKYQSAKRELGVIDFADLERMTLNLLRDDSNGVAIRLRDEFKFVLVDEFQDVNPIQAEILRLVSREPDQTRDDNLFAVGDVKQSIYRFRLAEPKLFLNRRSTFEQTGESQAPSKGIAIDLVENFRSRPDMIEAINAVFEKLMASDLGGFDYDEHARLKCGLIDAAPAGGAALELHILDKFTASKDPEFAMPDKTSAFDWEQIEREAYVIALRINDLVGQGYRYEDMVILLRSLQVHTGLLVRALLRLDIPVFADVSGGLFESLEILDVLSLLSLLDNEQQDIPLATVLRSPLFGPPMTDSQLAKIRTSPGIEHGSPFHTAVRHYAKHGRETPVRKQLSTIFERLRRWRSQMRRRPLADVLWEIYEESGYLAYVSGLREGAQRRSNLIQLHEYARTFGTFQRQGLYRFLRFLDGIRESGESLETSAAAAPSGNVVRIMTIHRSKGLEFPVVIVGELGKRFNLSDAQGSILFDRELGLGLEAVDVQRRISYPTLPHRLASLATTTESLAEELRILYVALTRAKEKLILVGTGKLPEQSPSASQKPEALPFLERMSAGGMLDWVAKAVAAQPADLVTWPDDKDERRRTRFAVHHYTMAEIRSWTIESEPPKKTVDQLNRFARMQPVKTPLKVASSDPIVAKVSRRLTMTYPAETLTKVPAVVSASLLKRRWNALEDESEPTGRLTVTQRSVQGVRFRTPDFLRAGRDHEPTHIGTWTHEFLQRLDLTRPCDTTDLKKQLQSLTHDGALTNREASAIDLDSIAWFFETELGRKIRSDTTRVLREWPFTFGVDPTRYDPDATARSPDDVMLVRGIIDVLFDAGDGWEVLDYKTDRVTDEELKARAELYAGQLRIYAAAVEAARHRRPRRNWLVFLGARRITEV